jgi:CRISPR/Cas system-associated endonuclease Cas1
MCIAIVEFVLDPTISYLHVCQPGRDSFVYDLMEPHRPEVDRAVLDFIRRQAFTPRDFVIDARGVCRLHPELARTLAGLAARGVMQLPTLENAAQVLKGDDYAARP